MAAQRAIIVDDTDSRIQYSGSGWSPTKGSQDTLGNFGPPYKDTLHGTNSDGSLSFSFSGTKVSVFGTNNLRNDSGVLDPTWECFIDNTSIGKTAAFQFPENNWIFCEADGLPDGPHLLTVNATVKQGQTFWFDDIQYVPSSSVSLDNTEIVVNNQDSAIQYGDGWGALGGTANSTQSTNSIFTFNFVGVSLSWYSFIPTEFPHGASLGSYSVDGQPSTQFSIGPGIGITVYNQILFETPQYPMGPHKIVVTYLGSSSTTPLALDFMIVQNGTSTVSGTSSPSSPASAGSASSFSSSSALSSLSSSSFTTASSSSSSTSTSTTISSSFSSSSSSSMSPISSSDTNPAGSSFSSNVGAIAGGVVGGIVLIITAICAVIYFRRWDRKQRSSPLHIHTGHDSGNAIEPFQLAPSLWSTPAIYSQYTTVPNHTGDTKHPQPNPNQSTSDINSSASPSSTSSRKPLLTGSSRDHTPSPYSSAPTNKQHVGNNSSTHEEPPYSGMPSKEMREAEAVAAAQLQPLRHSAHPTVYTVVEPVPPVYSAE